MSSGEFERIARLASLFGEPGLDARGIARGIGDDAAVLVPPPGKRLVWTVDEQVEGSHFRRDLLSWGDVGWRSFMAAASDLAAMAAAPWCALTALALPADLEETAFDAIVSGQRDASRAVGAPIVGGNLARAGAVSVTTTLLGVAEAPLERSGAQAGDGLWVAGGLGLAAAGLVALGRGIDEPSVVPAVRAWRRPVARIADGLALAKVARAAIDVSDGLAQDVAHLARASGAAGLCAVIDAQALLTHCGPDLAAAATRLGLAPLDLALSGGEDYALVAASDRPVPGFVRIGELREGGGIVLRTAAGERELVPEGFDHFRGG